MMSVMEAYISNPNPCMTKDASSLIKLKPQLKKTFTLIQIHYTKSTLIIFSFKKKKKVTTEYLVSAFGLSILISTV